MLTTTFRREHLSSTATGFTVQAGDFGGMYKIVSPTINAAGETTLELQLDINARNDPLANKFNVVLFDNDPTPTQYRFEFEISDWGRADSDDAD